MSTPGDGRFVDDLDRDLVERLRVDGRENNRALARALGVNEATIAARLRRLEESRTMHVVALTDMDGFGKGFLGFARITVADRTPAEVAAEVADIPELISLAVTTGRADLFGAVLARDRRDLGRVISELIPRVSGVDSVRCEVAVDVLRFDSEWAALAAPGHFDTGIGPACGRLDTLDVEIVRALQQDARSSNRSVALNLGVSEGTVRQRIRRMQDARLIRIRAVSDVGAFSLTASASVGVFVRDGRVDDVGRALAAIDGVAAVIRTVGEYDYLIVALAPTRAGLFDIVLGSVQSIPGVRATETFEVVGFAKHVYTWVRLVD